MKNDVNISIIGAGVIGLAIAARLSVKYDNIYVIEKNRKFGQETSSRNSEVIHSGIYYNKTSLKAKLCVKGNRLLYELCDLENIRYKKCGKLIVATNNTEIIELGKLQNKAINNGIIDLQVLNAKEISHLEPNVNGIKALYSPSAGIIDSHGLMKHLENKSICNYVNFAYESEVTNIEKNKNGYKITILDGERVPFSFTSKYIINCAGLESDNIANMVGIKAEEIKLHFCKGEYFSIKPPKNKLVSRLIYPVPNPNLTGLGIHATIDLAGGLKLGPNTIYLDKREYNYKVDDSNIFRFYQLAKRFLPFLNIDDLQTEMAGIRPKLQGPTDLPRDFYIKEESNKGFARFINLIGIESPGLTCSLSIAEYVEKLIEN